MLVGLAGECRPRNRARCAASHPRRAAGGGGAHHERALSCGHVQDMQGTPCEGFRKDSYCQLWSSYLAGRSPTGVGTWSHRDWLPGFTGPYPSTTLDKKIGCDHFFNCPIKVYHRPLAVEANRSRPGPGCRRERRPTAEKGPGPQLRYSWVVDGVRAGPSSVRSGRFDIPGSRLCHLRAGRIDTALVAPAGAHR